jgi:hypothetical protein
MSVCEADSVAFNPKVAAEQIRPHRACHPWNSLFFVFLGCIGLDFHDFGLCFVVFVAAFFG